MLNPTYSRFLYRLSSFTEYKRPNRRRDIKILKGPNKSLLLNAILCYGNAHVTAHDCINPMIIHYIDIEEGLPAFI